MKKILFIAALFTPSIGWASTTIPLTINLSEAVTVTGTPQIAVDVGGTTRYATYSAGSTTSTLTFTLTPQLGDVDLDGIAISSPIDLNGGTLKDAAGNNATLTFTPPNTTGIKVNYPSLGMDFIYDADGRYTLNGTAYNDLASFLSAAGGTFTRASTATYYDSTGTLQTAASGAPRFDYDPVAHTQKGILLEESRTNYMLYSHNFSNAAWASSGVTKALVADAAPDGSTNSVYEITVNASGGSRAVSQGLTTNQAGYVASIYLKAGTSTGADVGLYNLTTLSWNAPSSGATGVILSGPGTIVNHPSIVGGSLFKVTGLSTTQWTRVAVASPTGSTNRFFVYPNDFPTATQAIGDSVKVWGGQVELGTFATSYIPTTSATVTRPADILTIPTGSWFNLNESSIFLQAEAFGIESYGRFQVGVGLNSTNYFAFPYVTTTGVPSFLSYTAGGASATLVGTPALAYNTFFKAAGVYSVTSNAVRYAKNGALSGSASGITAMTSASTLHVGSAPFNAGSVASGHIQKMKYYPARVTDAQLPLLTQ